MKLNNKIILVTGSEGLIGREICTTLESHGAKVIRVDISLQIDRSAAKYNIDITSEISVRNGLELIFTDHPKIDGLVNNAYPRTSDWGNKLEDIAYSSWRKNVDLQMNSVFLLSQRMIEHFKENKSGSIVNIASIYGTVGPSFEVYDNTEMTMPAAYSAIKGGIINFSRYLATYLGGYGIRVNVVSPGGIYDQQNEAFVKAYEKLVPLQRMGNPEDIAPTVAFLLSDDAGYITGQNIIVDGGWTAR
ncbi:MAG: SDR family oxidoreductase [Crocinitomicaceae bacterium]|nr:SDR family oxidoreductase [Crocinitomicaceae bacterium]